MLDIKYKSNNESSHTNKPVGTDQSHGNRAQDETHKAQVLVVPFECWSPSCNIQCCDVVISHKATTSKNLYGLIRAMAIKHKTKPKRLRGLLYHMNVGRHLAIENHNYILL